MMKWSIGCDGGGTYTRAVLVDNSGVVQGVSRGGSGNFQRIGEEGLLALLDRLLAPLLDLSGKESVSLGLALAGAGRSVEQERIETLVKEWGWKGTVHVESDARAALEGAHAGAPGLIAIAGTGSIVMGKNDRNESVRAGGWGPLLGDEGSGYYLGLEALQAAARKLDGIGPATGLVDALAAELGLGTWDRLVPEVYGGRIDHRQIAALGPLVTAVAREGDQVALEIIERAGVALGAQVVAVAERLGLTGDVGLCCMGGVFAERGLLDSALQRAVSTRMDLELRSPLLPAVLGAVLLAWRREGREPDGRLLKRLRAFNPESL